LGKRNFATRDWPALSAAERAQLREIPTADRLRSNQAIEIATIIKNRGTTSVRQDWMVGDAGIEPATPPV
jgi:hypothetical protein